MLPDPDDTPAGADDTVQDVLSGIAMFVFLTSFGFWLMVIVP